MRKSGKQQYSTRCLISHRPPYRTKEPLFFRCGICGAVTVWNMPSGVGMDIPAPVIQCCGEVLKPLTVSENESASDPHVMDFVVFGGFEGNAVRVTVDGGTHPMNKDHKIEWVYLYSYQGGQLKYLPEKRPSRVTFAFAGEDAYVYCDRDVCKMGHGHCQFQCKRGNVVYAYCNVHGLQVLRM